MDTLKIEKATLSAFGWMRGPPSGPQRCKAVVSVIGYLIGSREAGKIPLPPRDYDRFCKQ